MAGRYTLHFKIFSSVASELEDFGGEVFQDCGYINSGCVVWRLVGNGDERWEGRSWIAGWMGTFRSDAHLVLGVVFEETFDTTTRELKLG